MKVENVRVESTLLQIYVNGRPGLSKMVMKDTPEELFGPAFMKGADGKDIYMTVPGEIIVAYPHSPKAANIICVNFEPVYKDWIEEGVRYRLVACDYRYRPPERLSR